MQSNFAACLTASTTEQLLVARRLCEDSLQCSNAMLYLDMSPPGPALIDFRDHLMLLPDRQSRTDDRGGI